VCHDATLVVQSVAEHEFPLDASKYSCIMAPSPSSQYRDDTAEALAASLHSEFSASSPMKHLAARCCQVINGYLGHVTAAETGNARRALHVGCATGRLTFELAALFDEASHHDNNCFDVVAAVYFCLSAYFMLITGLYIILHGCSLVPFEDICTGVLYIDEYLPDIQLTVPKHYVCYH